MIAINTVMTASLNRERSRLPEVGKKEELDPKAEGAEKEPLSQDWEEQDINCEEEVEEVAKTE